MTELVTPRPQVRRNWRGQPLIIPPGGGKEEAYTRCTTYIDPIDDKTNLTKWKQRQTALGLSMRPDLLTSTIAHRDDKRELDRIVDAALEAASSSAAATTGTSLHAFTEALDRGEPLPDHLPDTIRASLDAYAAATAPLKAVHIERFTVLDSLRVAGTPDRIVSLAPRLHIADIKTGSIEWAALKIAMQLAIYARSWLYDPDTGERTPHGADLERGLIIHLPAVTDPSEARCDLHWIDIEAGWRAVMVARDIREQRRIKFTDLTAPFEAEHLTIRQQAKAERAAVIADREDTSVEAQIRRCRSEDDVRAVWAARQHEWTDALTAAAKARIAELGAA